jgi:hypothetical protein
VRPYQPDSFEWPAVAISLAVFVVAVLALTSCHLDTHALGAPGHRIDQAPVVVVTPAKADDDGGKP